MKGIKEFLNDGKNKAIAGFAAALIIIGIIMAIPKGFWIGLVFLGAAVLIGSLAVKYFKGNRTHKHNREL